MENTINIAQFEKEHKDILTSYNLQWEWNCDLESIATGIIYYKDDVYLFEIKGVDSRGNGDRDGFLKILKESLVEFNLIKT